MATLYRYTWPDGFSITSKLPVDEVTKRLNRLDTLRVMTEGFEEGEGRDIYRKALQAYKKTNDFTGIIRLNILEKDFLGYLLEDDMLTDKERECINFYISER